MSSSWVPPECFREFFGAVDTFAVKARTAFNDPNLESSAKVGPLCSAASFLHRARGVQQTPISQLVTLQGSEGPLSQLSRRGQGSPDLAPHRPSDALLHARRVLEGVTGYRLLDDLVWHDETCRWFLRCRLSVNTADGLLPPKTDWCVVIEDRDPGGDVSIYPRRLVGSRQHSHISSTTIPLKILARGEPARFAPRLPKVFLVDLPKARSL